MKNHILLFLIASLFATNSSAAETPPPESLIDCMKYIPPSYASGKIVNSGTFVPNRADAAPTFVKLTGPLVLPGFNAVPDFIGCLVVADGIANSDTVPTVDFHLTSMSCISADGQTTEFSLEGYISEEGSSSRSIKGETANSGSDNTIKVKQGDAVVVRIAHGAKLNEAKLVTPPNSGIMEGGCHIPSPIDGTDEDYFTTVN